LLDPDALLRDLADRMGQEHRFAELLSHLAREITLRQASDVCCGDLTLEQFQTLRAVSAADQLSMGALSAQLRVDLSTMSRNVTVLERNGYLLRARDPEDARVVQVRLTAKGRRALETLRCGEREVLRDVYDQLPAPERSKVIKALEVLRGCLATGQAGSTAACCPSGRPAKGAS
jgi:DNA-binding MarR family transcriptional regulator